MFSMKHKSTYKRFPTNTGSKEINMLIDSGSLLLDTLDENIQNFRPCTNIEKSNTKTFSCHSNTSSEALGAFKAYTKAFDKTLICKFYVVKGMEEIYLEKNLPTSLIYYVLDLLRKLFIQYHIINSQRRILKSI